LIRFEDVSVTYSDAGKPALAHADFVIAEGELCLVIGPTGSGKSTLLGAVNGHVPHFTGGRLSGRVLVAGRDTATHRPRDLADVVGVVPQDPAAAFVTDTVEDEIAYGMESLGVDPATMRRRVEESLDLLGLADLRARPLRGLSGGQRQRVAIAAVLAVHPSVLVLDEPTSALDPGAAEEVLAALQRLVSDLGITVLVAEHRLERVAQFADRVILLPGAGQPPVVGEPAEVLAQSPVAPPVVRLAQVAGWSPVPVSVRDARRRADELRLRLQQAVAPPSVALAAGQPVARLRRTSVRYGNLVALREVDLSLRSGEVVALMGRNGAGKSTLLNVLTGLVAASAGTARVDGHDPQQLRGRELLRHVGLIPQDPAVLLWAETVADECSAADSDAAVEAGSTLRLLAQLAPDIDLDQHPRDLSEGQRLAVALAVVLVAQPSVLLLDEPTRGLDYATKSRLVSVLRARADAGTAVLLSTHDVELVAEAVDRVVILAEGEVVTDGAARDVVLASPAFAPQTAKVLHPGPWLTPHEVQRALEPAT
jgi:energy-coupling factor transport system ATP-binding protein